MNWRAAGLLLALGITACAGAKIYPNDAAKNLFVRSELDTKVRASLDVHQVDANCNTGHQGRVTLDQPTVAVGLPAERFSYLVVTFDSSSFFTGSSTASVDTLLKPRAGYSYELSVTYRDNIYNFSIRETDPSKRASRNIARRDLRTCTRT
jgi:hypothetical protein